jgi:hypothetical protein
MLFRSNYEMVSRVFSGATSARSRLARDICSYVLGSPSKNTRDAVRANNQLIDAIAEVCDGTPAHARALANVQQGQVDLYLLRLVFDHYPKGPPSAQFINPITMNYAFPDDVRWVPTWPSRWTPAPTM